MMEIREIREKDYASAIDVSNIAIKELFGTGPAFDFNFKIKNVFVTPGNVTRAIYVEMPISIVPNNAISAVFVFLVTMVSPI